MTLSGLRDWPGGFAEAVVWLVGRNSGARSLICGSTVGGGRDYQ